MPVGNESGASTQPWRTPASILNHELWVPPVRTQLTELSYSTLKSLTILSGIPSLVRSSHNAGRLRESNAARRSTNAAKVGWPKSCLHCATLHKVAMRSHVERPGVNRLCWGRLCDNNVGLILARMICANTLPAWKAELSLYNCYTPTWILFLHTEGLWCLSALRCIGLCTDAPGRLFKRALLNNSSLLINDSPLPVRRRNHPRQPRPS